MIDIVAIGQRFAKTGHIPAVASIGVLTATDSNFFPGLELLSSSLGQAVPMAIVDLGLTDEQREWCLLQGRSLMVPPTPRVARDVPMWQTWNKPFYLEMSPFQQTLWIDSDCVVVGDLWPLLGEIGQGAFVVEHWDNPYPQPNHEDLYSRFPVPARLPPGQGLNAGVIGLDIARDADLLQSWSWLVSRAADDPEIRSLISYFDEGALHWARQAARSVDRLMPRRGWNRFMPSQQSDDPIAYVLSCKKLPDDVIWHFSGCVKPW